MKSSRDAEELWRVAIELSSTLDEPPPAYPAMASDASDSVNARAQPSTRARPSPFPYLSHEHHTSGTPATRQVLLCSSLSLSPRRPARTLGPYPRLASDLPTSGTHLPPCHYVVISDNERVSTANPRLHACLRQKWARKQFRPEIRLQTRRAPVNEPLSRSIFQERGHGTVDNPSMEDAPSLDYWPPLSFFFFTLFWTMCMKDTCKGVEGSIEWTMII